jgi:GWxTD domain-containing protein
MFLLLLIMLHVFEIDAYRFEEGYVEIWYQLPVAVLLDPNNAYLSDDSISATFSFEFDIRNDDGTDSLLVKGNPVTFLSKGEQQDLIIDHLPLNLYPGSFQYGFDLHAEGGDFHKNGSIEITEEGPCLTCSDLVLGRHSRGDFLFRNLNLTPSIDHYFWTDDQLFVYLELYDLVPDSLYYTANYRVSEHNGGELFRMERKVLKYDYVQIDTTTLDLTPFVAGAYDLTLEIHDPSAEASIVRSVNFDIGVRHASIDDELYHEIQYLVSAAEYQRFRNLSAIQKEIYLKDFWTKNDYEQFAERIHEADARFSAGQLTGRDSERGSLFIKVGPPDEIEIISMAEWSRPLEVWHYYGRNDYLFSDIKNDHNPRLIRILKPGELTKILTTGKRDGVRSEEWMSEIAPGTFNWYEDQENPE